MTKLEEQKYGILVIEPTRLYRKILESQLNHLGLTAEFVFSAKDASDALLAADHFRLIVCATELPDSNGIEFCKKARKLVGDAVPILMLSTITEKELIREALNSGLTEVIQRDRLIELQPYLQRFANLNIDPKYKRPHILFVEDSEAVALATVKVLEGYGYYVDSTTNAEQATGLLNKHDFDLIITDILLEGNMTGMNLIRHVRRLAEPRNHLPILAISGLNEHSQKIESLRLGATDFVTKPINYEELNVRMENLIKTKRLFDRVFEQEQQLKKLAMTDPLTGLYNRHYLQDVMNKRLKESDRHHHPLSIIVIDLDKFKLINDRFGHLHGDQALKDVANLLSENCRQEDFAVRFGGEEFVLILPHCGEKDAVVKAQSLRQQIFEIEYEDHHLSASMGVASKSADAKNTSFQRLFEAADKAVYKAKDQGRNCVVAASELKTLP